jgi:alanyl-tRNA synthetase
MSEKAAHTAEHVFAGALSKIVPGLRVHKVELGASNSVTLEIESLDWDTALKAEIVTNNIIAEGRAVRVHTFRNLDEAKGRFEGLRSREDRIVGDVRVVEIDGFDYAACTGEHVQNTKECSFFLISGLSESGGTVKVEFLVGEKARNRALEMCSTCFKAAKVLATNVENLEKAAEKAKLECYVLRGKLMDATDEVLKRIQPLERDSFRVYQAFLRGADKGTVMERAGRIIEKDDRAVTIFAIQEKGFSHIIMARGKGLPFDCRRVLEDALRGKGFKGGGKADFASGIIQSEECEKDIESITESLRF